MPAPEKFWEELFATAQAKPGEIRLEMRALRKHGRPFLLLPLQPRAAAAALQLYPAQTSRARLARNLMRTALGLSMPVGTESVSFTASSDDPFVRFLVSINGKKNGALPPFAILAGNPASDGQRFLILVFDAAQKPIAVVKAGITGRAKSLIEKEESLLHDLAGSITGIPRIRGVCQSSRLRAIAFDFFPGDSPRPRHESSIPPLLTSWLDQKRKITLRDTADWARLEAACPPSHPILPALRRIRDWSLHPALQHGDFAPWNIKVSPTGAWTVLDWERGELIGIPAWDWFHYVVQPAILVEKLRPVFVVQRVEQLLGSPAFRQYAVTSGINGCERELVLAYLLHAAEVINPSEGLNATRELLTALAARWRMA